MRMRLPAVDLTLDPNTLPRAHSYRQSRHGRRRLETLLLVSEEREKVMGCCERLFGARLHAAYRSRRSRLGPGPRSTRSLSFHMHIKYLSRVNENEEVSRSTASGKAEPSGLEDRQRGRQ